MKDTKFNQVVAMVSGGPDSMAMLDIHKQSICAVCHVNYKKRKSADRDQKIVKNYCKEYGIRCFVYIPTKKDYQDKNFQSAARKIRYDFAFKVCKKLKCNCVITAHNLDDFIETAYMQESRRSRTLFKGIKNQENFGKITVYRPVLNCRKKQLEEYCMQNNIQYGIDETNFSDLYERNKVRKIIQRWSISKFNSYLNKINNFNTSHKKQAQQVEEYINKTKNLKWNNQLLKIIPKKLQVNVFYHILRNLNINNPSANKINGLINFLKKNDSTKQYRISNNTFIKINSKIH